MRVIVTGQYTPFYVNKHNNSLIPTTGASGVLGSQVFNAFAQANHDVLGLAHSRASEKLRQLDLMDSTETESVFKDFKPDCK